MTGLEKLTKTSHALFLGGGITHDAGLLIL